MRSFLLAGVVLVTPAFAHAQVVACDTTSECSEGAYCIAGGCRSIAEARTVDVAKPYGMQVLVADAIAVGTLGTGALFSGPIVHLAHHRPLTALESFGLRVFGISLSAGTGVLVSLAVPAQNFSTLGCFNCGASPNYLPQMFAGMMIGAGIGWLVSSMIDAFVLARPPKRAAISSAAR